MRENIIITDEGYAGLNPMQLGYENCEKSHGYGPATRTHWLIHFVESGFGIFRIYDKEYTVREGEMFIIPPYVETYYEADANNPWSYIWIGFTTKAELPLELPAVICCPKALRIFTSMKNAVELENGRSAFLSAKLWELFSVLLENKKQSISYVGKALDCIHSEYMYDLTIEKLAARLGLDHSYFSALFKNKMGISPKQYLFNYRMNVALSLIIDNGVGVSVAAYSVGYTDICNFSKMFKKHFGMSPRQYIKSYQSKKEREI
ncbi:MAG: AraC family transcriptional regulator [Ruminococcaceae bacterium]|nr:AraC family transcriptional regulator [Oscillospiraceae bacterium]